MSVIFDSLIFSKIVYALPAFAGQFSVTDKNRINKLFRKAHRRGLVLRYFDTDVLIDKYDWRLFKLIQYPDHCQHYLQSEK